MAIKINFDVAHNPESPTLVLATRNGTKLGSLYYSDLIQVDSMISSFEMSFKTTKYIDDKLNPLWDQIVNFKLVWCREWDTWFEIYVEIDEDTETIKTVSATKLGDAELSQTILYSVEINTEDDIARDDYEATILYNFENKNASLLDRILEKAPHYSISHVDATIANIQRTFSFDGTSIYDAFKEIGEEINCLFIINSNSDEDGNIVRSVSVYDLESYCLDCKNRGEFTDICPECGSTNISDGFGEDTTIFITADELGENIKLTTDNGATKNCFKLEGGDDLFTSTIRNCNPNGTDYIWYLSDDVKKDMSPELVSGIDDYDSSYSYYQNQYETNLDTALLTNYNNVVNKYKIYKPELTTIKSPIVGYSNLIKEYYNTIDLNLYLQTWLMPDVSMSKTSAELEAKKLSTAALSPVAVENLNIISCATADNAVLAMAKVLVNSNYQVKITTSSLSDDHIWTGSFIITNYSDDEDVKTTNLIQVVIDGDLATFTKQKIDKIINKEIDDYSIVGLFKKSLDNFKEEIKKYSLDNLSNFYKCCQGCIDILVEQGISDPNNESWGNSETTNLYDDIYLPYYNKLQALSNEMKVREDEIAIVVGTYDENNKILTKGLQNFISDARNLIQKNLDFQSYLGEELWLELCSYRREDKYSNDNYISDGLDTSDLFEKVNDFLKIANKELYKSAELQHSITTTLKNLLVIPKFEPLIRHFEVGNWIRIRIDDVIYKLRLLSYEIDYNNINSLSVEFSDVLKTVDGLSDQKSILDKAASMSTTYSAITKQAEQGKKANEQLTHWITDSLSLTNMKITSGADNQNITWDSHGILCKEYLPITDNYSEEQLKIINCGLYITNDNWKTAKAGIGTFNYFNPETGLSETGYGVIADTLVGNLILSEKVGVYNKNNSIILGNNGLVITTDESSNGANSTVITIQKRAFDDDGNQIINKMLYIDDNGDLVMNGTLKIQSTKDPTISTLDELCDTSRISNLISSSIDDSEKKMNETITNKYLDAINISEKQLNDYKADIGQYLNYNYEEGLILGAYGSLFKTVIDNNGMYFKESNSTVAYLNNKQLYIRDAVIQNTLILGNFFFSPRSDGGVSLTWQE